MIKCRKCMIHKNETDFNSSNKYWCKDCYSKYYRKYYQSKKEQILKSINTLDNVKNIVFEYKSKQKCCKCGFSNPVALDFHHIKKSDKIFTIGNWAERKSINLIIEEISKCIVLCKNCHAIYHYNKLKEYDKNSKCIECGKLTINKRICSSKCKKYLVKRLIKTLEKNTKDKTSILIGISLKTLNSLIKRYNIKYENKVAKQLDDITFNKKPSKEELEKLIWEKPTTHIAKDFNVSDKAVEKWCKKYGISKPPRGYWVKNK